MTAEQMDVRGVHPESLVFKEPFTGQDRQVLEECAVSVIDLLEAVEEVREATDECEGLSSHQALAALRGLELVRRLADAASTDLLAHYMRVGDPADYGYRTTASLLQGEFRITGPEARRRTALASHLGARVSQLGEKQEPQRPMVAERFAEGRISADEARVLCDQVEELSPALKQRYEEQVEATLVELSPTVTLKDVPKLTQRIIQCVDPDGTPPQFQPEPHKYSIALHQKVNGDWNLRGLLDCPTGSTLYALLYARMKDTDTAVTATSDSAAEAETEAETGLIAGPKSVPETGTKAETEPKTEPGPETGAETEAGAAASRGPAVTSSAEGPGAAGSPDRARDPGADRTPGVHEDAGRSSALVEPDSRSPGVHRHERFAFLLRCLSRDRVLHGADHALVVTATAEDLLNARSLLATHSDGPVTLPRLEAWSQACQMLVHIVEEGGRTVAVHSQGRFATRSQMIVLAGRDRGCSFPDCEAPAQWCEAHHIVPVSEGGPTHVDNMTLVCPFHHRWFERSGWTSVFRRGLPAWMPPRRIDPGQTPVFHSRFRAVLLDLPPVLGIGEGSAAPRDAPGLPPSVP